VIYLGRILPEITPNSSLIRTAEVSHLLHSSSQGNERETVSVAGPEPRFVLLDLDLYSQLIINNSLVAKSQQLLCLQSARI